MIPYDACADRLLIEPYWWRGTGSPDRALRRELMHWRKSLAALFVVLALAGCAQGTTGQAGAPYAPYSPESNGIRPEHGGGMAVAVAAVCSWRAVRNSGGVPQSGQAAGGAGDTAEARARAAWTTEC